MAKKRVAKKKVAAAPKRKAVKKVAKGIAAKRKAVPKKAVHAKKAASKAVKSAPKAPGSRTQGNQTRRRHEEPRRRGQGELLRTERGAAGRCATAFLPEPGQPNSRRVKDDLAEEFGEEFVASATSGEIDRRRPRRGAHGGAWRPVHHDDRSEPVRARASTHRTRRTPSRSRSHARRAKASLASPARSQNAANGG